MGDCSVGSLFTSANPRKNELMVFLTQGFGTEDRSERMPVIPATLPPVAAYVGWSQYHPLAPRSPRSLAQRVIVYMLVNKSISDLSGTNGCLRDESLLYA
jgi:hypothetical protein